MHIYLIKDYLRVDGVTGQFVEREFAGDEEKFDRELVLHTAMNQYVSFQVVFQTDGRGIDSASLNFEALQGSAGLLEPDTEVFIEWFHETEGQAIPDLLIPMSRAESFKCRRMRFICRASRSAPCGWTGSSPAEWKRGSMPARCGWRPTGRRNRSCCDFSSTPLRFPTKA